MRLHSRFASYGVALVIGLFASIAFGDSGAIEENIPASKALSSRLKEPVVVYETDWFRIIASKGYEKQALGSVAPLVNQAVTDFCRLFKADREEPFWSSSKKGTLVYLKSRRAFQEYVKVFEREADPEKLSPGFTQAVQNTQSFYWIEPLPYAAACGEGASFTQVNQHIFHLLGHILLTWYEYNYKFTPPWLHEGYGAYTAVKYAGGNILFCTQGLNNATFGYGVFSGMSAWARSENWPVFFRQKNMPQEVTSLSVLGGMPINEFKHPDTALSWSFVSYLIEEKPEELRAYVRALKGLPETMSGKGEWTPTSYSRKAFRDVFKLSYSQIQKDWRSWARNSKSNPDRTPGRPELSEGGVQFDPNTLLDGYKGIKDQLSDPSALSPYERKMGEWISHQDLQTLKAKWILTRKDLLNRLDRRVKDDLSRKVEGVDKSMSELVSLPEARYLTADDIRGLVRKGFDPSLYRAVILTLTRKYGCSGAFAILGHQLILLESKDLEKELGFLEQAAKKERELFEALTPTGYTFQIDCWPGKVRLESFENGMLTCKGEKVKGRLPVLSVGYEDCRLEDLGDGVKIVCPISCVKMKTLLRLFKNQLKKKSAEDRFAYGLFQLFRGDYKGAKKECRLVKGMDQEKKSILACGGLYQDAQAGARLLSRLSGNMSSMPEKEVQEISMAIQAVKGTSLYRETWSRSRAILRRLLFEDYITENRFLRKFYGFKGINSDTGLAGFSYAFEMPIEMEDFDLSEFDIDRIQQKKYKIQPFADNQSFHIQEGRLIAYGVDCLALKPIFSGEVDIEIKFRIKPRDEQDKDSGFFTLFGYGLDQEGGYVASSCLTHLEMQNSYGRNFQLLKAFNTQRLVDEDKDSTVRLRGTSSEILYVFNGAEKHSFPLDGLRRGRVFLWVCGARSFEINDLSVKGQLDPQWLRKAAENAVEEELKRIF